jgi:peptidoglycan/LPS O-acetylase OafA/YrhL
LLFYGGVLRNTFVLAALMFGAFVVFYSSQAQIWGGLLNPALSSDTFSFGLIFPACFGGPLSVAGGTATALTLTTAMMAVVTFYWLAWMPSAYALDRLGLVHRSLDSRLIAGYSIGLWLFVLGLFVIRIRARIISWFGRISYSFYLTHQAGLYLPFWLTLRYPPLQNHPMIYYLLVATVTSTLLAAASYYLVERRFIRLGHRLTRRPDLSERSII